MACITRWGRRGSVVSPVILLAVAELTGAYETAYTLIAVLALSALLLAAVTPIRMLEQKQHCGA